MRALELATKLDQQECCQNQGGPGCHPARCNDCPREAADELRRLHRALDSIATVESLGEAIAVARTAMRVVQ
ncbi:hypothetical protein WK13_34590 [Burkholderia ubonensis]|nr:hypothetical protein WK13_34590 [Burkholderia ubonensis]